jgi:prolyl-tRNA synthetase
MGSYGIGSGRLLACVAEEHHDGKGLIWPISVAPYHAHLVSLARADDAVGQAAERVYRMLLEAGIEVLFDDRDESPGVKFADADLIGVPIRLTVSAKSIGKGGVEMKRRDAKAVEIVAEAELIGHAQAEMRTLFEALPSRIVGVPFK